MLAVAGCPLRGEQGWLQLRRVRGQDGNAFVRAVVDLLMQLSQANGAVRDPRGTSAGISVAS